VVLRTAQVGRWNCAVRFFLGWMPYLSNADTISDATEAAQGGGGWARPKAVVWPCGPYCADSGLSVVCHELRNEIMDLQTP
jgi:hypothetical protein